MAVPDKQIYPRTNDTQTVYLANVVTDPAISVGAYTMYNDFVQDPTQFQKNNVLYHYPINHDRLVIGKFCSIACGAKFLFTSANHTLRSLSAYPFPLFYEEWGLDRANVQSAWDNKGDIIVGNDVWIGYEAVILAGVTIGDGAIIGARALVTKDVEAYTIVGGVPAKPIRRRFPDATIAALLDLAWWDWPKERIARNIAAIQSGDIDALTQAQRKEGIRIETQRLSITPRDFAQMNALYNAERDAEMRDAYREMIETMRTLPGHEEWGCEWAIRRTDGEVVGGICFKGMPDAQGTVEIGYGINAPYQRNGYATEAVAGMTAWALAQPNVVTVTAQTQPDNHISQKVLTHNGFVRIGDGAEGPLFGIRREN